MPLVELFFALPLLIWGGVVTTWLNARGIVIKLWAVVWGSVASVVIPAVIWAVADESARHVIRGVFD